VTTGAELVWPRDHEAFIKTLTPTFSLSAQIPRLPVVFGPGRIDSLDRQILETICGHGREGQSFNRLVAEVQPFASRSTFALRTKRLVKLNYAERFPDGKNRQMKRLRGTPMMLLLARISTTMKAQCTDLERAIHERTESIKARKALTEDEVIREIEYVNQTNDKIKGVFSLVGVYAVNLGETAAADIILPMVIGDFKRVNSALASLLASNPQLTRGLADERLAGIPLGQLRDDFKYAFGVEIDKALPKFSKHLKALSKTSRAASRRC
jgi:hypothetical protein